ncbi:flagellar hook-basal body complex protein FliE [Bacillus toyonensis]|uniref:flagellar hook-basal body complex protein FliE n=1 Tax=Bacillus toyonensis TaxID=155322 RepID=UPI002E1A389B|nr:flagellar hook-basal body complex protein FliE [Bacillus toyonensis]MED2737536.1 flagellar hook-basal body complex protein FliE [Bacillus toyonensis]
MDIISLNHSPLPISSTIENRVDKDLGISSEKEKVNGGLFNQILDSFVEMNKTQVDSKTQMADVIMGRSDNSHGALIALQKAELQMSFASSVRDKVVQGVNQLFNMQI